MHVKLTIIRYLPINTNEHIIPLHILYSNDCRVHNYNNNNYKIKQPPFFKEKNGKQ